MTTIQKIEELFNDNNWVVVEGYQDEPIPNIIEKYDISSIKYYESNRYEIDVLLEKELIVHKIYINETMFSNLRFHDKDIVKLLESILEWDSKLSKLTFNNFIETITPICYKTVFNDNGIFHDVKINK